MNTTSLRQWAKNGDSSMARMLWRAAKALRYGAVPCLPAIHAPLYAINGGIRDGIGFLVRTLWTTPLFQSRLEQPAQRLYVYGGMPLVLGPVKIAMGSDVRLSGHTTISGKPTANPAPRLEIGNNVGIGWQTTIAVGTRIVLGDNVRIAGRAFLAGYPGHPLDAEARAAGKPCTASQAGDIILEKDVWLATGVSVMAGVTIGEGTIVAAGSVVTSDLPPGVIAAGMPARVIRPLPQKGQQDRSIPGEGAAHAN